MAASQPSNANTPIIPGVSQNMSLKIGRSVAELAKPCFTAGSSRVSRSRAAKALGLRSKRKAVSPQSPPSPNQESAMNTRTGKVAFGPWMGPYEAHADVLAAGPLFLDPQGNTYDSIKAPKGPAAAFEGLGVGLGAATLPHPAADGGKAPAAAAATQQLYAAMVGKLALRHAAAQVTAASRARVTSQWPGRRGGGKPYGSGGRCSNTMARHINQPRRS